MLTMAESAAATPLSATVGAAVAELAVGSRTRTTGCANKHAGRETMAIDRKSTRLNSSHLGISYAVFCLEKKRRECSAGADAEDARTLPGRPSSAAG